MKGIIIKILAGIILFSTGIAVGVPVCRMYDKAHTPASAGADGTAASAEAGAGNPAEDMEDSVLKDDLQLRVRDGNLEWYDGVRWNYAGTVNELVAADPIAQPSEEWQALAARLAETRAGEHAAEMAALSRDSGSLLVDEIAAARPQTQASAPAVTRPTTSAAAQPAAPASDNAGNNDNNDDDDNDDDDDHNEAPAPEPEPEPEPEPAPEPDDTGDGENIEWSGDYE